MESGHRDRGERRKLFVRVIRLIKCADLSGMYTARELRDKYAPFLAVTFIQKVLAEDPRLIRTFAMSSKGGC